MSKAKNKKHPAKGKEITVRLNKRVTFDEAMDELLKVKPQSKDEKPK